MLDEFDETLHALMLKHQCEFGETATTTYLAQMMGVGQPSLDPHFKKLLAAGMVVRQKPPLREAWRAIEKKEK